MSARHMVVEPDTLGLESSVFGGIKKGVVTFRFAGCLNVHVVA